MASGEFPQIRRPVRHVPEALHALHRLVDSLCSNDGSTRRRHSLARLERSNRYRYLIPLFGGPWCSEGQSSRSNSPHPHNVAYPGGLGRRRRRSRRAVDARGGGERGTEGRARWSIGI